MINISYFFNNFNEEVLQKENPDLLIADAEILNVDSSKYTTINNVYQNNPSICIKSKQFTRLGSNGQRCISEDIELQQISTNKVIKLTVGDWNETPIRSTGCFTPDIEILAGKCTKTILDNLVEIHDFQNFQTLSQDSTAEKVHFCTIRSKKTNEHIESKFLEHGFSIKIVFPKNSSCCTIL